MAQEYEDMEFIGTTFLKESEKCGSKVNLERKKKYMTFVAAAKDLKLKSQK